MSGPSTPDDPERTPAPPSRREVLRPLELLGGAALAAIFVALIVLMVTRDWIFAGISLGGVFIVVLVVLAMFVLSFKPDDEELADLDEQDHDAEDRDGRDRGH